MAKEKTTTTMDSLEPLDLGEGAEAVEPVAEEAPETKGEAKGDEPTSFLDAMNSSINDEPDKEEPQPEPEPAAEPEAESRSSKDFKKIKEDRDTVKRELETMRSKLAELEGVDNNGDLKQLQEERDQLSEQLRLAAIERHPTFQREYQTKIDNVVEASRKLVDKDNADRVAELIQMGESDYRSTSLDEIMVDLSTTKQAKMGALLARIDEIRGDREAALTDADSTYQQLLQQETAQRENHATATGKVFDVAAEKASNSLELYQMREGDESWNSEVTKRLAKAKEVFAGENEAQYLAEMSLMAAGASKWRELLGESLEVNRRLKVQLKDMTGASPSVAASTDGAGGAVPEKSFLEGVQASLGG